MKFLGLFILILTSLLNHTQGQETPLGFPIKLTDVYIKGKKIEPIPRNDHSSSLVIRILQTKSASEGYRYDLEVYGLDPGSHLLKDYLHYIHDQSPVTDLKTELKITTIHPLDSIPSPKEISHTPPEPLGGYRTLIIVAGVIWSLIFLSIIFYRKKQPTSKQEIIIEKTLQERLSPLVTASAKGELSSEEQAHLERLIMGHWKQKLPNHSFTQLRQHPDSSPLILKLEQWLHSPNPTITQHEISDILAPFSESNI